MKSTSRHPDAWLLPRPYSRAIGHASGSPLAIVEALEAGTPTLNRLLVLPEPLSPDSLIFLIAGNEILRPALDDQGGDVVSFLLSP